MGGEIRFTDCCEVKFSKVGVFFGFRFIVSIVASLQGQVYPFAGESSVILHFIG